MTAIVNSPTRVFQGARDFLLANRTDYNRAYSGFVWPRLGEFNWALDWFDVIAVANDRPALWIVNEDGRDERHSFAQLSTRSSQLANGLRQLGVMRGDRVLIMLGNEAALWETILAAMKLGAVLIPAALQLTPEDLADRFERGHVRHVVASSVHAQKFDAVPGTFTRIAVGCPAPGWHAFDTMFSSSAIFRPDASTRASDPMLLYFTSGTTSKPKLVLHSHESYPVGHLSTMYWIGLQPDDIHLNISSPGWAKHAWSCVFAPWNACACAFVFNYARFDPLLVLEILRRYPVGTMCAPPTVWRMLVQTDLKCWNVQLRELVSAGEPLNPEVIELVRAAWGIAIRDGYGQTETTCQIGNSPGQRLKAGSMGRPLPGFRVELINPEEQPEQDGEVCLPLNPRPVGLMLEYIDDPDKMAQVTRDGLYRTGDIARRDEDGYITYVGRADDVFKASDYRISPFELESVLIEHPAVAEAAVVPSPDSVRTAVIKAFIVCGSGHAPSPELAEDIMSFCRQRLAPYKRIRRLEFAELPKTISGKIRRGVLRCVESERRATGMRSSQEFWEEDFAIPRSGKRTT